MRPIGTETGPGQILDTNSLMLAEQVREAGCEARCLPIEPDDPERIAEVVREAAPRKWAIGCADADPGHCSRTPKTARMPRSRGNRPDPLVVIRST